MRPSGEVITLDAGTPTLFLSDLHFGDGTGMDLFAGQDEVLMSFLDDQRQQMGAIVFLGDIMDLPQAWSVHRIRPAHGKLMRYLTRLVRSSRVIFVRGNHDWAVNYEALFPGATSAEAVQIGDRILAWHGHQVDLVMNPGAGNATRKTYAHALLERAAGQRLVPPLERYDSLANRAALAIAVLWCRVSMTRARALRVVGQGVRATALEARVRYLARSVLGDPADVFGATDERVLGNGFDAVVCGHTHVPGHVQTSRGEYVNSGTWTFGMRTYAQWTGERFLVREVDTDRDVGDEDFAGLPVETEPQDLFRWWDRHHRGFLRFDL